MRKTLSTVADSREPLGRRISGMLLLLAGISMLIGFGLCASGKMTGVALFFGGPVVAVVALVISAVTDAVMIRRTYDADVERVEALRRIIDRGFDVSVDAVLKEMEWTLQDLRRPLALLLARGEVVAGSGPDDLSILSRSEATQTSSSTEGQSTSVPDSGNVVALHTVDGDFVVSSLEGALVADDRYRRRMRAKVMVAIGWLMMVLGVPAALADLSGDGIPIVFESGLALLVIGYVLDSREEKIRSRAQRKIRAERDRIVYALLHTRDGATVGDVRAEVGWTREEVHDVLGRLSRKKQVVLHGASEDSVVVIRSHGGARS